MISGILKRSNDKAQPNNTPKMQVSGGFDWLGQIWGSSGTKRVRSENADTFSDIYDCINVLSDDIAKLPIKVFKKKDGIIYRVSKNEHALAKLLAGRPNRYMNAFVYKKLLMIDVLTDGNHYTLMRFDEKGNIVELFPLTAATTRPILDQGGKLYYQSTVDNEVRYFEPWEIIHIKGLSRDGITGKSPIRVIAERVEANEAANAYNTKMLEKGATPNGILKVEGSLGKEAKTKVKEEWKRVNGSDAIAVIDSGLQYQQLGISQKDMEFIETQRFNRQKIASIYKMPLHKINDLSRATFSNIEHQSLEYVKNTMQPHIAQIEIEFDTQAFTEFETKDGWEYYIKFNVDSELRGDSETRARVQKLQVETGAKVLDEIRAQNEDSPYEGEWGSRPLVTLNWTFLDNLLAYQNARAGVHNIEGGDNDGRKKGNEAGASTTND